MPGGGRSVESLVCIMATEVAGSGQSVIVSHESGEEALARTATLAYLARTGNLDIAIRNRLASPRRLMRRPAPQLGNWSVRRLNALHSALPKMTDYLEIGLAAGATFEHITLPNRVGVDPYPKFNTQVLPRNTTVAVTTSDDFFSSNDATFDLVFLDGLHTYVQTYRDLMNAIQVCPTGAILIDDVVPLDDVSAMSDQEESLMERRRRGLPGGAWHGDIYRLAFCVEEHHQELAVRTITDRGNPQMLLWKPDPDVPTRAVDDLTLDSYSSIAYSDAFSQGIPDLFGPVEESEALSDAARALTSRYGTS